MFLRLHLLAIVLAGQMFGSCASNICAAMKPSNKNIVDVNGSTEHTGARETQLNQVPEHGNKMSAQQILNNVASTYAKCKSYKDSGMSITEFTIKEGSKVIHRAEFHTAMRRGAFTLNYRFAYRINYFGAGYAEPRILWHDGQSTMVSNKEVVEFEKEEFLNSATAKLTGLTSGTAHDIPALLMPTSIRGRKLVEITSLKPPKQEKNGKKLCYRLEGLYAGDRIELWIEKDSFLVLRIVEHDTRNGKPDVQTTSYIPEMNEEVPDRLFDKQVEDEWDDLKPIAVKETSVPEKQRGHVNGWP